MNNPIYDRNTRLPRIAITLVEVLVVIAIVGIVAALLVCGVQQVRASAARAECANKIRQLALSVQMFEGVYRKFPEGCAYPFRGTISNVTAYQSGLSWQTQILPFVDQGPLSENAWALHRQDPTGDSALHNQLSSTVVPAFRCPTERLEIGENRAVPHFWGITSYLGIAGSNIYYRDGIFHPNFTVRIAAVTDGISNTLLIGERPAGPKGFYSAWYATWGVCTCPSSQILEAGNGSWDPMDSGCMVRRSVFRPGRIDEICDVNHYWSLHSGGANFAFADGSVRFLNYSASPIIAALATRAGAEIVEIP